MSPDTALVPQPTLDDFPEFVSIPFRVACNARLYPDKHAAMCEGTVRTWGAFDRRINQIARTLAHRGIDLDHVHPIPVASKVAACQPGRYFAA